jgi:hypothetical protein
MNQNSVNSAKELYAVLYTNSDISISDLNREILDNKILPVLILRVDPTPEEPQGHVIVPCFVSPLVAQQFARRNLPKKHFIATIQLNSESLEALEAKGYEITVYNWPNRVNRSCHLDLEVVENSITPEITRHAAYKV